MNRCATNYLLFPTYQSCNLCNILVTYCYRPLGHLLPVGWVAMGSVALDDETAAPANGREGPEASDDQTSDSD